MSTPYVTFPGTDWAFTDDVNLLDADTAHIHQSKGYWVSNLGAKYTVARSTDFPLYGSASLKYEVTDATALTDLSAYNSTRPAVSASTQYTFSSWVYLPGQAGTAQIIIAWKNAAGATTGTATSSFVAVPANTWTLISHTATSPALTVSCFCYPNIKPTSVVVGTTAYSGKNCLRAGAVATFVPSLRIVGDLDVRASVAAADWTPAAAEILLDQYVAGTGGYRLGIETSGAISLTAHGATGAISESSSLYSLTDGEATEIRVTMDASAGDLTWYQDNVEVDDDTYTAQALKPAGLDLYVGALSTDASHFNGDIYWLEVRDGIGGPVVARFDAADIAAVLP